MSLFTAHENEVPALGRANPFWALRVVRPLTLTLRDRWVTCSLGAHGVQGGRHRLLLYVPQLSTRVVLPRRYAWAGLSPGQLSRSSEGLHMQPPSQGRVLGGSQAELPQKTR